MVKTILLNLFACATMFLKWGCYRLFLARCSRHNIKKRMMQSMSLNGWIGLLWSLGGYHNMLMQCDCQATIHILANSVSLWTNKTYWTSSSFHVGRDSGIVGTFSNLYYGRTCRHLHKDFWSDKIFTIFCHDRIFKIFMVQLESMVGINQV